MNDVKKTVSRVYLGLTLAYIATMFVLCSYANGKIADFASTLTDGTELQFSVLNSMQKPIATANIIFYVILFGIALWIYSKGGKKVLTYLPVLIFSVFTLFGYVTLSGSFFSIGGNNITHSGSYWLMFFIGLFFIAGAICITVIGTIAVRNLLKRQNTVNK